FTDLNLNLLVGGSIRTKDEYKEILSQCGFELIALESLPSLKRCVIWAKVYDNFSAPHSIPPLTKKNDYDRIFNGSN
ncbi:MAG: hypothetical protein ABR542_09440, partial [Desulfonatronovibrio sp.]